jgi:hypothetical protein
MFYVFNTVPDERKDLSFLLSRYHRNVKYIIITSL